MFLRCYASESAVIKVSNQAFLRLGIEKVELLRRHGELNAVACLHAFLGRNERNDFLTVRLCVQELLVADGTLAVVE